MSIEGSLAAAGMGHLWQRIASRNWVSAYGHAGISDHLAPDARKTGQEEEESRRVSRELWTETGARAAVFPDIHALSKVL